MVCIKRSAQIYCNSIIKETDSPLKILPLQNDKLDYVYDHCLNLSLVNINKNMCEGQFFPDRRCRAL